MTDLTPNDLSHLGDAEFFALCPQGEHAPGHEPLSTAAQAVMEAYCTEADLRNREVTDCEMLAAALRSVADQVVPQSKIAPQRNLEDGLESMMWGMEYQTQATRHSILAIADELEGLN